MIKFFTLLLFFFIIDFTYSQNIGINETGATPDNSAMLDIVSNDKGILIPRVNIVDLTTAAPITTPAISLMVYNTNTTSGAGYYFWNGTKWVKIYDSNANSDEDWYEANTTTAPNDINDDIFTNGNVGIGLNNPGQALDIFNGNIEFDTEFGIGRNHGSATSEWVIRPYRTGFNTLNVLGSVAPFDVGMSLESDALIGFIETDNENLVGWMDVNSKEFIWDGKVGLGTSNPNARLEAIHTNSGEFVARLFNTNNTSGNGLLIESNGGNSDDTLLLIRSDLDLNTGNILEDFVILSSGRTGIAHTNPNVLTKLDVDGYMIGQNFLFSAFSTTEVADFTDGIINFTEQNDPHNNYTNNTYTAPVSGFYFFSCNMVFEGGDGGDDSMNFRFLKNGISAIDNLTINPRFNSEPNKEVNISHSTIVQLNAGETISISIVGVQAGSTVDYARRNFMGYMISK